MPAEYWVSGAHKFTESENSVEVMKVIEGKIAREVRQYENLDLKIDIFANRTKCWFLNHAQYLANLLTNPMDGDHTTPGDYAAVVLACSQLEGFQKYKEGYVGDRMSKKYFNKSIEAIFIKIKSVQLINNMDNIKDRKILDFLYKFLRCGAFHAGFPDGKVYLDRDCMFVLDIKTKADCKKELDQIVLNPVKFVEEVIKYFNGYIFDLKNTSDEALRENFEKRWDHLWKNS